MGTYGGPNDENTIKSDEVTKGKTLYPIIDTKTGVVTWYERKGSLGKDIKLGTREPGKKFIPYKDESAAGEQGFSNVFSGQDAKDFLSDKNQKELQNRAIQTAKDGCIEVEGSNKEACAQIAEDIITKGETTVTPGATADEIAGTNSEGLSEALSKIEDIEGTDKGISKELRYPLDMAQNQDVIKFSMVKYKVKGLNSGSTFGTGERSKVGSGNRQIIATAILPVPGQIQDTNSASWSDDSANAGQLAFAGLGKQAAEGTSVGELFQGFADKVVGNSEVVKKALTDTIVGGATGVNILGRTGGVIINPNLELLFSKPALREFSLSFRLSARSKKEGLEVIKIIRFFKQGMAPIREASNLFLKAPNTFQVQYLLRGKNSEEHPFIGRMKECALTSVNTNYTPENNYATYEDGLMVSYQINLTLKELEPVYNDNYQEFSDTEIGF